MILCGYGCGKPAKYPPRKGRRKWCCNENYQQCDRVNSKHSIEKILKLIEVKGYKLVSGEYENVYSSLTFECKNGHIHKSTLSNLVYGGSCKECSKFNYWTIDKVKDFCIETGYTCLSDNYTYIDKLKFKCPNDHIFDMRWDIFYCGSRCLACYNIRKTTNMVGSGNPNWKGGIQSEPYCPSWSIQDFKESIKIRDNYKCMNPCCFNRSKILVIHHIDYDKKNCDRDNLITLCNSCNVSANYNRVWHEEWYKIIMDRYT